MEKGASSKMYGLINTRLESGRGQFKRPEVEARSRRAEGGRYNSEMGTGGTEGEVHSGRINTVMNGIPPLPRNQN